MGNVLVSFIPVIIGALVTIGVIPKETREQTLEEINFSIRNFPKSIIAYLSGTLICPTQYDLSEVKNKVWYLLMLISIFGLLITSLTFLIIDSPVLKTLFVGFTIILLFALYLRSIDKSITSNDC